MQLFLTVIVLYMVTSGYCQILKRDDKASALPIVTTPVGKLRGSLLNSKDGKTIYSFRGVRYAQPPVGDLRFKPPVPAKNWTGIYNATSDPPSCPQTNGNNRLSNISEDCLFLNVYTSQLQCPTKDWLQPVMVFFHPGGFYEGTCNSSIYGPQYLLDRGVVLVVLNYRLGALGFISTGTKDAPGNNGMKDQVIALKWVKKNIASFCGNPKSVTIFGDSAGGLSVTSHLTSPMSRGLFHRAISMSGSIFGNLPIGTNQLDLAKKQARLVNCPDNSPEAIISCLKTKSAQEIANTRDGFNEFLTDPIWLWTPVIEPDFGQERFLTEHPIISVEKGNFSKVPIIIGITRDEFGAKSFDVVYNATTLNSFDKDYLEVWPIIFSYERNTSNSEKISKGLRKFYFPNGIDNSTRQGIADLYADGVIGFGANRGAKLLAKYNSQKVYYYLFDYHGRCTLWFYPNTNDTIPYGASHGDDLCYLFYVSTLSPLLTEEPELRIVNKLTKLWTNFAKTGSPTPDEGDENWAAIGSVRWPPFDLRKQEYVNINLNLIPKDKLFDERYKIWEKLIPLSDYRNQTHES